MKLKQNKEGPDVVIGLLNEWIFPLLPFENCKRNCRYLFHIILSLVIDSFETTYDDEQKTTYDLILDGVCKFNKNSIMILDPLIIQELFDKFTRLDESELITSLLIPRRILLEFLVEIAKNSTIDVIEGGILFFKNLLSCVDAEISYVASQFLVYQLEVEKPTQYTAVINKICQRTNLTPELFTKNAYVQIKTMMEFGKEKPK